MIDSAAERRSAPTCPASEETFEQRYQALGLGPLPDDAPAAQLYIDMVKRVVANIIYQDRPVFYFDARNDRVLAREFDLEHRLYGKDLPSEAHTMVGIRRLENLHRAVETVLRESVPGDLLEAGVLRGGAAIFLRAILKAHGIRDRRVIACDTFTKRPTLSSAPHVWLAVRILALAAAIPGRAWRRRLFFVLQRSLASRSGFAYVEDPSDEMVEGAMWLCRNVNKMENTRDRTSLTVVRSHFARYGLLDDQVVFLQGLFSDTLPQAPLERLALLRLDGDTYESTRDVLEPMYPKLSPGGYCIIDDYHAFPDCRRAVDAYRTTHGITEELCPIDQHAVFWRKKGGERKGERAVSG
jgi:hypothetical protein